MKRTQYFSLLPAFAFLTATTLLGQEGQKPMGDKPTGHDHGLEQPHRPPTFVKAPTGSRAVVENADEQRLGVIRDHVIDRRSGHILFVVVGSEKAAETAARLVPYDRFTWDVDKERFVLPLSAEELDALPEYKALSPLAGEVGLTGKDPSGKDLAGKEPAGGDKAHGDSKAKEAALPSRVGSNLASSEVLGSRIVAARTPFAAVEELVIETQEGRVAFVLANGDSAQADPYVIPWQAMKWEPSEGDEPGRFAVSIATGDMAAAPRLERGSTLDLKRPETLATIYGFYKLTPPVDLAQDGTRG